MPVSQRDVIVRRDALSPNDSNLPRFAFIVFGIVGLLPWNLVLTFDTVLTNEVFNGYNISGLDFAFLSTFVYAAANCFGQIGLSTTCAIECLPFATKYVGGLILNAVSLMGLVMCNHFTPSDDQELMLFVIGLACVLGLGASAALVSTATFGLGGSISPKLVLSIMFGQGVGGIATAVIGFIETNRLMLDISYCTAVVLILACLPLYLFSVRRNPHVVALQSDKISGSPLVGDGLNIAGGAEASPATTPSPGRRRSSTEIITQSVWPQAVTVSNVFIVTFVVFPGVIIHCPRATSLIQIFQIMDVVGRYSPDLRFLLIEKPSLVSVLSLVRWFFVPIFIWIQRAGTTEGLNQNVVFEFGVMALFAFSNGYVSTLSMMLGPQQRGLKTDEQEVAASIMSTSLVSGILLGSLFALLTQIGV
eukprot:TRINITY_DN44854_c0_g1_i1.p1 TRINITY_DN44854_c0_g1~~TRINITY_DN44854_c0_g1_i1.p1  ORF type:complete len:419 (+),score=45.04 TRINITY_DN44854_c0_g1_i1:52-1308(+)